MQEYSDDLMHIKTSAVMQQYSKKEMQKNTKKSLRLNTPENLQRYLQKYLLVQNLQKETWVWTRIFLILVHAVKSLRKLKANCCFVALKRLKQLREAQLNIIISLLPHNCLHRLPALVSRISLSLMTTDKPLRCYTSLLTITECRIIF